MSRFIVDDDTFSQDGPHSSKQELRGHARLVQRWDNFVRRFHCRATTCLADMFLSSATSRSARELSPHFEGAKSDFSSWQITFRNLLDDASGHEGADLRQFCHTSITEHAVENLHENPSAYQDLIYPRTGFASFLSQDLAQSGLLDEEFRFIRGTENSMGWAKASRSRRWRDTLAGGTAKT